MRISIIDADEDNVGRRVPADPSVPSPSEDVVSTPSHNSDRYDKRTDNESVLYPLPVVAFDSPHLDPAHRGHTLYAVRLCNTRKNDMGSGIGLPTPGGLWHWTANPRGLWHWTANPRGLWHWTVNPGGG
jgi:hypothetical protein